MNFRFIHFEFFDENLCFIVINGNWPAGKLLTCQHTVNKFYNAMVYMLGRVTSVVPGIERSGLSFVLGCRSADVKVLEVCVNLTQL